MFGMGAKWIFLSKEASWIKWEWYFNWSFWSFWVDWYKLGCRHDWSNLTSKSKESYALSPICNTFDSGEFWRYSLIFYIVVTCLVSHSEPTCCFCFRNRIEFEFHFSLGIRRDSFGVLFLFQSACCLVSIGSFSNWTHLGISSLVPTHLQVLRHKLSYCVPIHNVCLQPPPRAFFFGYLFLFLYEETLDVLITCSCKKIPFDANFCALILHIPVWRS